MSLDDVLHGHRFERIFSLLVIILILWIGLTTDSIILRPWVRKGSMLRSFLAIAFNATWVMALWSMIMAGWTDPGSPPPTFSLMYDLRGVETWCKKCGQARPPRAHHCKSCRRCILRMDHHCPWIGNCVGYRNHGHFLRFLVYALIGMLMAVVACVSHLFFALPAYAFDEVHEAQIIVTVVNGVFSLCLAIMVGLLAGYQLSNALYNMTTIEHLEWDSAVSRSRRQQSAPPVFPYDLGDWRENLDVVLGPRRWAWALPLPTTWQLAGEGDGLVFKKSSPDPWPPTSGLESEPELTGSQSDPSLHVLANERRGRFRRGSEGYMIPADQIGVRFGDDEEVRGFESAPLLTISQNKV